MMNLREVHKSFDDLEVLKGVDLTINRGEIISIIGSSGSGKSTLLRVINGLETASHGQLEIGNLVYKLPFMKEKDKRSVRKRVSMVFQNYNLFKHKTALENVIEGLVVDGLKKSEAIKRGQELLDRVGLRDKQDSYPSQLSGGQQQRVGIARAMALKPEIILFDEPTSALDPELVQEVLAVIKQLADESTTMVIVTHEMRFAQEISDRILFMNNGIVEVETTGDKLYKTHNTRLQNFLGIQPGS